MNPSALRISGSGGNWLRNLDLSESQNFQLHQYFGWVTEKGLEKRRRNLVINGAPKNGRVFAPSMIQFEWKNGRPEVLHGTATIKAAEGGWTIDTGTGEFYLAPAFENHQIKTAFPLNSSKEDPRIFRWSLVLGFGLLALFFLSQLLRKPAEFKIEPVILEPVVVKVKPERQRPVVIPMTSAVLQAIDRQVKSTQVKRAIQQDLGFLGLLGRKDLKKALGGAPTQIKDASAGAGAGGSEGSGGELLVGLGQGVQRTTVGNSGVAGLGGVGTKGKGGGAGGYGNSLVGSGEGGRLTAVPISQDVVLEGGLDKSVIQATIAKYLSQVRACYEQGLARRPGLTGQVTMAFEINGTGSLNFSRVARTSLGDAETEQCISSRMMGWRFPKPLGGVAVKVSYPFMLRPVGM